MAVPASLTTLPVEPVGSIDEATATMQEIGSILPPTDGLAWFNLMYLIVTETPWHMGYLFHDDLREIGMPLLGDLCEHAERADRTVELVCTGKVWGHGELSRPPNKGDPHDQDDCPPPHRIDPPPSHPTS